MQKLSSVRAVAVLLLLSGGVTFADEFDLDCWTIDGGADLFLSGADFELSATIGQPDAGYMSGGEFDLSGGVWFECCRGDVDGDCDTDQSDLGVLLGRWGIDDGGDLDGDGITNQADLGILLADWGCGT